MRDWKIGFVGLSESNIDKARHANRMRVLIVGEFFPWPAWGGGLMRLANSVEALSALGEADLFTLSPRDRELPLELPPEIRVNRLKVLYPRFLPCPLAGGVVAETRHSS